MELWVYEESTFGTPAVILDFSGIIQAVLKQTLI